MNFIRENKDNPFFLYVPFTIPHAELAIPDSLLEKYKGEFDEIPFPGGHYGAQEFPRAAYAAMVTLMDYDIGRILDLLEELKLTQETLIVFTSDNGPHKEGGNDPGYFDSNGPLRGIKRDLYEGGIRVPFIVRWPGKIPPDTRSDHVSAFWDFLPTVCEIAEIDPPPGIDGISYLPALMGQKQTEHDYLYWEFHEQNGKQAVRKGNWKAVRLNVRKDKDSPVQLYDLATDTGETNNVADQFPEIVRTMEEIMSSARTKDPAWPLIPNVE